MSSLPATTSSPFPRSSPLTIQIPNSTFTQSYTNPANTQRVAKISAGSFSSTNSDERRSSSSSSSPANHYSPVSSSSSSSFTSFHEPIAPTPVTILTSQVINFNPEVQKNFEKTLTWLRQELERFAGNLSENNDIYDCDTNLKNKYEYYAELRKCDDILAGELPKKYMELKAIAVQRIEALEAIIKSTEFKRFQKYYIEELSNCVEFFNMQRLAPYEYPEYGMEHLLHSIRDLLDERVDQIKPKKNGAAVSYYDPVPQHITDCFKTSSPNKDKTYEFISTQAKLLFKPAPIATALRYLEDFSLFTAVYREDFVTLTAAVTKANLENYPYCQKLIKSKLERQDYLNQTFQKAQQFCATRLEELEKIIDPQKSKEQFHLILEKTQLIAHIDRISERIAEINELFDNYREKHPEIENVQAPNADELKALKASQSIRIYKLTTAVRAFSHFKAEIEVENQCIHLYDDATRKDHYYKRKTILEQMTDVYRNNGEKGIFAACMKKHKELEDDLGKYDEYSIRLKLKLDKVTKAYNDVMTELERRKEWVSEKDLGPSADDDFHEEFHSVDNPSLEARTSDSTHHASSSSLTSQSLAAHDQRFPVTYSKKSMDKAKEFFSSQSSHHKLSN